MNTPAPHAPRKRAKSRQFPGSADHPLVVRHDPKRPVDRRLLAEALMLHAVQAAARDGRHVPKHLAGLQKLVDARPTKRSGGSHA